MATMSIEAHSFTQNPLDIVEEMVSANDWAFERASTDEMLVEVPAESNLREHAENIRDLMILGMKQVVPDVRIDVEYTASTRWYKGAKAVYDDDGNLLPWGPQPEAEPEQPVAGPLIPPTAVTVPTYHSVSAHTTAT